MAREFTGGLTWVYHFLAFSIVLTFRSYFSSWRNGETGIIPSLSMGSMISFNCPHGPSKHYFLLLLASCGLQVTNIDSARLKLRNSPTCVSSSKSSKKRAQRYQLTYELRDSALNKNENFYIWTWLKRCDRSQNHPIGQHFRSFKIKRSF